MLQEKDDKLLKLLTSQQVNSAEITTLKERLAEQQEENHHLGRTHEAKIKTLSAQNVEANEKIVQLQKSLEDKNKDFQNLLISHQRLQSQIVVKNSAESSLHSQVESLTAELGVKEQTCQTLEDIIATLEDKLSKKIEALTKSLANEKTLMSCLNELDARSTEKESLRLELEQTEELKKQLTEERDAQSQLKDAIKREKARFSNASKQITDLEHQLNEKALVLNKSLDDTKAAKAKLRDNRQHIKQLMLNMQTLKRENADVKALMEHHEDMVTRKKEIISQKDETIAQLQKTVERQTHEKFQAPVKQELRHKLEMERLTSKKLQIELQSETRENCDKKLLNQMTEALKISQDLCIKLQSDKFEDQYSFKQHIRKTEDELCLQKAVDQAEKMMKQQAELKTVQGQCYLPNKLQSSYVHQQSAGLHNLPLGLTRLTPCTDQGQFLFGKNRW
ncbi:intracellular protein transport protein USO1-like isoform X2 [Gouania willdenowi]|uniref:intracellular protein transport protein USO1-like isoform X2 n=1 Tax=Gouania willdenowi TaxID=441366 RepID=UPI001055074E|nr:intracellular protein transport protein USO1-like isoform X2 [Gouania willdenowi]